jgi:hypothetical protein
MRKRDVAANGFTLAVNLIIAAFFILAGIAAFAVGGSLWSDVLGTGAILYGLYGVLRAFGLWL